MNIKRMVPVFLMAILLLCNNVYAWSLTDLLPSPSAKAVVTGALTKAEARILSKGTKKYMAGRTVIINNRNFSLKKVDATGRSNCQRMNMGLAPLGHDGLPVNLHHLHQENDGTIVEILESEHRQYSKELHSYKTTSEIDRAEFNTWKKDYWKERGVRLCK